MVNKNKGIVTIAILGIILGVLVIGGGAYYLLSNKNNKIDCCTEDKLKELDKKARESNINVYPLYNNLSWKDGEEYYDEYYKVYGFRLVSENISDTDYYKFKESFYDYYDKKLTSLGWSVNPKYQADGAGSSVLGYTKEDKIIILRHSSEEISPTKNEPFSCPCNMTFSIFYGDLPSSAEKLNTDSKQISSEESTTEVFDGQPGIIKQTKEMVSNDNIIGWELTVDILTNNPRWTPGSDTEDLYLNESAKIRKLFIDDKTETYECGHSISGDIIQSLMNTSNYVYRIKPGDTKSFYIKGTHIDKIFDICLP